MSLELQATGKFGIIQTKKSFSSLVGDARIPRVPTTQILWSATGMNSDLTSIEFQNQNQFLHRYNNCKALCFINSIRIFLSYISRKSERTKSSRKYLNRNFFDSNLQYNHYFETTYGTGYHAVDRSKVPEALKHLEGEQECKIFFLDRNSSKRDVVGVALHSIYCTS